MPIVHMDEKPVHVQVDPTAFVNTSRLAGTD